MAGYQMPEQSEPVLGDEKAFREACLAKQREAVAQCLEGRLAISEWVKEMHEKYGIEMPRQY